MKSVVFDLDGTLADTSADLLAAARACLAKTGYGPDLIAEADAAAAMLGGGRGLIRLAMERADGRVDERRVEEIYPVFIECYDETGDVGSRLYDGVKGALRHLRGTGYRLAVCTNKPEGPARRLLARLGIAEMFEAIVGADTMPVRKPRPEPLLEAVRRCAGQPARTAFVGDSETDRNTARAAGIVSILVTFGPLGESVAALNPGGTIERYEDLAPLVTRLIG